MVDNGGNGLTAMISLDRIEKVYRTEKIETLALSNVHLAVAEGEFLSVMGPSGCGKSTLLNIMGLLDVPTKGTVAIGGKQVGAYGNKQLARLRNEQIGFVFQSYHLIPDLRVADNVEIPLLYRSMPGKERRERVSEALDKVGLTSRADHFPSQLSGGQQQRTAIARAIVGRPRILLADEPTGNLDSQMGDEIVGILAELNRTDRTTIVMVTHDPRQAEKSRRIVRFFDGRQVN